MATIKKNKPLKQRQTSALLGEILRPGNIWLSNDAITGVDGSVSIIRIVDGVSVRKFPLKFPSLFITMEFSLCDKATREQLVASSVEFRLELENPQNEKFKLGSFLSDDIAGTELHIYRLIIDIASLFTINHSGPYHFRLIAANAADEIILGERQLIVGVEPDKSK